MVGANKNTHFLLVDCNNFYTSCESVFDPSLLGRAVVVLSNNDGCIVARSKKAKDLGVGMGVPFFQVKELLEQNDGRILSSNYRLYGDMSQRVQSVLKDLAGETEVYSIDESFIPLRGTKISGIVELARKIRDTTYRYTGIPVSVGCGRTRTLAKLAAQYAKRGDGVQLIPDNEAASPFLEETSVNSIWGIGPARAALLHEEGVHTAAGLILQDDRWIRKKLTLSGLRTVLELRGESAWNPEDMRNMKQAVTSSRSFASNVYDSESLGRSIEYFSRLAADKLFRRMLKASSVTVFISTDRFSRGPGYFNRVKLGIVGATNNPRVITGLALEGLSIIYRKGFAYSKAGVILEGLQSESEGSQLDLFGYEKMLKEEQLVTALRKDGVILYPASRFSREEDRWKTKAARKSPDYTTDWNSLPVVNSLCTRPR